VVESRQMQDSTRLAHVGEHAHELTRVLELEDLRGWGVEKKVLGRRTVPGGLLNLTSFDPKLETSMLEGEMNLSDLGDTSAAPASMTTSSSDCSEYVESPPVVIAAKIL